MSASLSIRQEESTPNHWIGWCGDLVLVFAYQGSHDDIRHVMTGAALVERLKTEGRDVKLLFALPPLHSKPPSARVRAALVQVGRRLVGQVSKVAVVVVGGSGFGAAVHRSAVTGVIAIVRPKIKVQVVGSFRDGLGALLEPGSTAMSALLNLCDERAVPRDS